MALAVGTDIVEIQRIAKVIARQGDLFVKRILCDSEQAEYQRLNHSAAFWLSALPPKRLSPRPWVQVLVVA